MAALYFWWTEMDMRAIAMGMSFAFLWSSAFTSARIIVAYAPPLTALSLRFFIAGIVGLLVARAFGETFRLSREQWRSVVVFGICQNVLYLGMFFVAMQTLEASLAAIIAATMPLMVAAAGWVIFGDKIRPLGIAGLVAGTLGVLVIMGARVQGGVDLYAMVLCIIGTAALSAATLAVRSSLSRGNVMMMVGYQMLVASVVLAVCAFAFEDFVVDWTWQLAASFLYTTFIAGLLATWIWFFLVRQIGIVRAATYHFLNPLFGVLIAIVLLGETLSPLDILGVLIVGAGILAVQYSKQPSKPALRSA